MYFKVPYFIVFCSHYKLEDIKLKLLRYEDVYF